MKKLLCLLFAVPQLCAAQIELSEIMKGYDFIGAPPTNVQWSVNGEQLCFDRLIKDEQKTICYSLKSHSYDTVEAEDYFFYDESQSGFDKQFEIINNGIVYYDKIKNAEKPVYLSVEALFNLQRVNQKDKIFFQKKNDLFVWNLSEDGPSLSQVSNFTDKKVPEKELGLPHLLVQQQELFEYFSELKADAEPKTFLNEVFIGKGRLQPIQVDPTASYLILRKYMTAKNESTSYMDYVTSSGAAEVKQARPKVSANEPNQKVGVYHIGSDSVFWLDFSSLTDVRLKPKYLGDSVGALYEEDRSLFIHPMVFSAVKTKGVLDIRSADNKDRWIVLIDLTTGEYSELVHERDEAWIGGPGISSWNMVPGVLSWVSNDNEIMFQSERTGFSHLYAYNLTSEITRPLTDGSFEIRNVQSSKNEDAFYITCNKTHPGNREVYLLNIQDNTMNPLFVKDGAFELCVSPDEKYLAYRYSYKNKPWEVFLSKNTKKKEIKQLTNCTKNSFDALNWLVPAVKTFKASDDTDIYFRVYEPDAVKKNNAAVVFVHGAGYLQNAHNFWSNYYREFMFHNLLVEKGYTVLDVDYRGSDGYGRDHRTSIYRHMGGYDLDDNITVKRYAVDSLGIDAKRIGIYGGSYGGFITLMALLTKPEEFACGAALRSVTDWAHYNHEYTSNILNYPETDSIAYRRSSPIYFAENLEKPLLMLHGMVDDNVQFQDVVRLSQRFIELGKTDWDLAVFPVEPHGFKKASSWTDEYRRILRLFETYLK